MATREEANKARRQNLVGRHYGRLTVEALDIRTGEWLCVCACGARRRVPTSRLNSGNTKSCGCLQKERAALAAKEKHRKIRQQKGLPEEYVPRDKNEKDRAEFSKLSRRILERDSFSCVWCEKVGGKLAAHHLKTWEAFPEGRFLRQNLVTLCYECHLTIHQRDYHKSVEPVMTILLMGYASEMEAICSRVEVT